MLAALLLLACAAPTAPVECIQPPAAAYWPEYDPTTHPMTCNQGSCPICMFDTDIGFTEDG